MVSSGPGGDGGRGLEAPPGSPPPLGLEAAAGSPLSHDLAAVPPGSPPAGAFAGAPAPAAVAPSRGGAVLAVADFVFRLVYFLSVPLVLFFTSLVLPLTGAFVNMGLLVTYFLVNPLLRPLVAKRRWLARPLKKFMAFEAFYRDNPPRVFVYYVFFPILFPYWLVVKRARREFLLFRGLSIVALVILIGLALLQYFTKWAPDIGFGAFAAIFGIIFLVQGFVVLTFLMPLATTVIGYQTTRKYKRLVVLFAAMAFSTTAAIIVHAKKRHDIVPAMTVARIGLRTAAAQEKAAAALQEGMIRAINEADAHPEAAGLEKDVEGGVELTGATVEAAREGLATYYKDDETHGFILAVVRDPRFGGTLVLYAVDSAGKPLIWLASVKVKGQWRVLKGDALAPESVAIMTKIAKK